MTTKDLLEMQTQRGAKIASYGGSSRKTFDEVVRECRDKMEEQSENYRDLPVDSKKEYIKQIIINYVMNTKPLVEGFISGDNIPDTVKLTDRLIEEITDYGILTQAINDPEIYEIRANGKEIKIERKGKVQDLRDKEGKIVSFENPEQQEVIMKKLLGSVKCTPKDAIVNSSTVEGYRIAAVHSSAMGRDPKNPNGDKYNAFVLRKFSENKFELSDIVRFGTMSDDMARLLSVCALGSCTVITAGPTSSGKTTTNNAYINAIKERTVIIQNPSEIDARKRDITGRVVNDVLHLEGRDIENATATDPTPENLLDHTLRLSPTFICFGELRKNSEFAQAMKCLLAGHPMNATYHSGSVLRAIRRFLTAYTAASGEPADLALETITELLDFVVIQRIMRDGTRKVIEIAEVIGVDENNKNKPLINTLYKFKPTGSKYDENGELVSIEGKHVRVGKISDAMVERLMLDGIPESKFEFVTKEVTPNEKQTYTGNNIETYGDVKGE